MKQFFHRTIKNKLRKGLYKVVNADHSLSMPDPKKFIFQQFIYSFVPISAVASLSVKRYAIETNLIFNTVSAKSTNASYIELAGFALK